MLTTLDVTAGESTFNCSDGLTALLSHGRCAARQRPTGCFTQRRTRPRTRSTAWGAAATSRTRWSSRSSARGSQASARSSGGMRRVAAASSTNAATGLMLQARQLAMAQALEVESGLCGFFRGVSCQCIILGK